MSVPDVSIEVKPTPGFERYRRRIPASDPRNCRVKQLNDRTWILSFEDFDDDDFDEPRLKVEKLGEDRYAITLERHQGAWTCDVLFGSERVMEDVGFWSAGARVVVDLAKHPRLIYKSLLKPLTYYAPMGGSFGVVSRHHMRDLPHVGWNVHFVELDHVLSQHARVKDPIAVIHPTFYAFQSNPEAIEMLKRNHRVVAGFDLADTDALSPSAVEMANQMDLIMVPSKCSRQAYLQSGVRTRVEVVPHGVSELFAAPKDPLESTPKDGVKVLFFYLHSPERKGADIVRAVMSHVMKERSEVRFVIKGSDNLGIRDSRVTKVPVWLSEQDLVRLYDSCDILLAPSRGGGFELNVLEGLARGLVVITSDWPAIKEYARGALFIRSRGRVKPLPDNPIHVGYGVDPDPDHACELIHYAIDNLDGLKKLAQETTPEIRRRYTWRKTAKRIARFLEELA